MRIVYVTDAFAVCGGIERVLTDKMIYLEEHYGYDVTLLTIYQGPHSFPFKIDSGIQHVDLNIKLNQQYNFWGLYRLYKRWKLKIEVKRRLLSSVSEVQPDVIVCVKLDCMSFLLEVMQNSSLIFESHTLCHAERIEASSFLRKIHMWILKRYLRKVKGIIALTEGDAKDWRHINHNVCVIPNVVHLNDTNSFSSCTSNKVVFVGRFSKQKDIGCLLDIWMKVFQRNPEWSLHIYGEVCDVEENMYVRVQSLKNLGVVYHTPVKDNMIEEYKKYSILLLSSLFEPFGLVLPEAMSCGLPVVSFDCPYGPADIVTDGLDGFLIKNRDVDTFADRVCQLIEDQSLRQRMGQAAIKSAQRYRVDQIMPKWKKLFEEMKR